MSGDDRGLELAYEGSRVGPSALEAAVFSGAGMVCLWLEPDLGPGLKVQRVYWGVVG